MPYKKQPLWKQKKDAKAKRLQARDVELRRRVMRNRFQVKDLKNMAIQYGFTSDRGVPDITSEDFLDVIVPPGSVSTDFSELVDRITDDDDPKKKGLKNKNRRSPRGFGDDLGYDGFDPERKTGPIKRNKQGNPVGFGDDLGFDDFEPDGSPSNGKYVMDIGQQAGYTSLIKGSGKERKLEHPVMVLREPDEDEVKTGFMYRYFIQQANSPTAPIIEIDKEQYEGWLKVGGGIDRSYYVAVLLKWRIKGSLQGVMGDDGIYRKGVLEGNQASVKLASKTIPALESQVQDYIKYWTR